MTTKIRLFLKIMTALFFIKAVMNYHILLALPKMNYYFTLQYVAAAFILIYFVSAVSGIYTAFWNKNLAFLNAYVFILSSCGLTSPVFPIPCSFLPPGLPQGLFIFGVNALALLFVLLLHLAFRRYGRLNEEAIRGT
jgi:hypothetical protein